MLDCLNGPGLENISCLQLGTQAGGRSERGDVAIFEDGERRPQAKEYTQPLAAEKGRDMDLSRKLQKGTSSPDTLI